MTLDGSDSSNWTKETNLGDLTTDALKWYAAKNIDIDGVDSSNVVAIQNGGNCDQFIYPGDVTSVDLLSSLPFSPMGIGVLYVKGTDLLEALEAGTSPSDSSTNYGNLCPGFAQVSGINYTVAKYEDYDAGEAYGHFYKADSIKRVTINSVNGKAFDKNATYAVVADNYVIKGNDTYYMFKEANTGDNYINNGNGMKTRDIVTKYVKEVLGGTIGSEYASAKGRIKVVTDKPTTKSTVPEKGKTYTVGNGRYTVTKSAAIDGRVEFYSPKKETNRTFTVPKTVKINGYTFKVTSIGSKAFYKNTKLRTVVIGSNVALIRSKAFYGDKSLRTIKVNTRLIKKGKVGSKAFKGIYKTAKIKVPKSKFKAYKSYFKNKGQSKKVKIVKY